MRSGPTTALRSAQQIWRISWRSGASLSAAKRYVFGSTDLVRIFAGCIRRDRPRPNDKWHLDEVVIPINSVKHWLWRAVDANGDILDILVQTRRNAKAAKRFLASLIAQFGQPRVVVTDKLRRLSHTINDLSGALVRQKTPPAILQPQNQDFRRSEQCRVTDENGKQRRRTSCQLEFQQYCLYIPSLSL